MPQCVGIDPNGFVVSSAADPCTTAILLTPAEHALMVNTPWAISVEDAQELGMLMVGVWVIAWCFRALTKAIGNRNATDADE